MKTIIFIIVLFLLPIRIFGQQKSMNFDTLTVIKDRITVKISVYETGWLKDMDGFKSVIDSLKTKIELIKEDISKEGCFKMTYNSRTKEIIIENKPDLVIYSFNDRVNKSRINECIIASTEYDIYIYFNDLDEFLNTDIQNCINKAIHHEYVTSGNYAAKTFHGIAWSNTCKCENDTVIFIREKSHYNANKSQLSIKAGTGIGILRNQFTTDFSFRIGKFQTRKGILKHHIYISDNMHYVFDQTDHFQINNFLNLGYRFNGSNRLDHYNWIGFEVGYLTNSNENFFKTPAFRFATMIDVRHNITLSPQMYFEDGFKKVYPGIRMGIDVGL